MEGYEINIRIPSELSDEDIKKIREAVYIILGREHTFSSGPINIDVKAGLICNLMARLGVTQRDIDNWYDLPGMMAATENDIAH